MKFFALLCTLLLTCNSTFALDHKSLAKIAVDNSQENVVLTKKLKHFKHWPSRLFVAGKNIGNFAVPFRGFAPSSEMADILLNEKNKLNSAQAVELAQDTNLAGKQLGMSCATAAMAQGLGMNGNPVGFNLTNRCFEFLTTEVGTEEAGKVLVEISQMHSVLPENTNCIVLDNLLDFNGYLEKAMEKDEIVTETIAKLHKYNKRSNFARFSAHVIETLLGVTAHGPCFIGPAGEAALLTFMFVTGGPEQSKIVREVFLYKRLILRQQLLAEEIHLALDCRKAALLTKNPVLLGYSDQLIKELTE